MTLKDRNLKKADCSCWNGTIATLLLLGAYSCWVNILQVDGRLKPMDVTVLLVEDSFSNMPYFEYLAVAVT